MPVTAASAETVEAPRFGAGQNVSDFYASRQDRPLWTQNGQATPAALQLLRLLDSSAVDKLPGRYRTAPIVAALGDAARGTRRAGRRAEQLLSQAFSAYARDLRSAPHAGTTFVEASLRPFAPSPRQLLNEAAAAPSLSAYVEAMGWMNPLYAPLRKALASSNFADPKQQGLIELNLERVRALPAARRFVLVNAAAQELFMYEDSRVVDRMKVVVGKPKHATPMMAATIRYASLNPFWNVPPDLAAERIAPIVRRQGLGYLKERGYEVLSSWDEGAEIVDPKTVDWAGVEAGTTEVRLRQLPGKHNAMGKMKFMFPNQFGVYLHDTPERELLSEASRLYSGGCVRLEDASRLSAWLFGAPLKAQSDIPEVAVNLDRPVPVVITYLTAVTEGSSVTYFEDIYGRDAQRLAQMGGGVALGSSR